MGCLAMPLLKLAPVFYSQLSLVSMGPLCSFCPVVSSSRASCGPQSQCASVGLPPIDTSQAGHLHGVLMA